MVKLILCDLGNVLINFDHRIAVRRILPLTPLKFDEVYQLFFDSPLIKDFEEGKISSADFFVHLSAKLHLKNLSFKKFETIWNEIFFDNSGMVEVLAHLKKRYRLHLVSNINELHYRYLAKKFPRHFKVFDKVYLSYEVGRRKPHKKIYHEAVLKAGFQFGEALYTDDRLDLIDEAKKIGIPSILFKDVGDFKKQLKGLKIYP